MPQDFDLALFSAPKVLLEEKRLTFVNEQASEKFEDNIEVVANGSSSVFSGSVSQEIDVVDLYKKKIQSNIHLKQKNLKAINILFIFALFCYIFFAGVLDFGFDKLGGFVFRESYLTGLLAVQAVTSRLLNLAFIVHFNHLFIRSETPVVNGGRTRAMLNATEPFDSALQSYLSDATETLDEFIKMDPHTYLDQPNELRNFVYNWSEWNWHAESPNRMTLFGYLKSLSVELNFDELLTSERFEANSLYNNAEEIISKLVAFDDAIRVEFDLSRAYINSFLFYFILIRCVNKWIIFSRNHHVDDDLFGARFAKLRRNLPVVFKNPNRAGFLLSDIFW